MEALRPTDDWLRRDESLRRRTSFRIGGSAPVVEPASLDELQRVLVDIHAAGRSYFVLGGGTNTLIDDSGVEGVVVSTRRLNEVRPRAADEPPGLVALPGALLQRVVIEANRLGLAGMEDLTGIPGTIGGAVFGNAGGAGRAIEECVESMLVFDHTGSRRLEHDELPWRYRSSGLAGGVIGEVVLRLGSAKPEQLAARTREVFQRKRDTQPLRDASAGCVFRNPPGHAAGELVERAGLKGLRIGGAVVSTKHANFIVNDGGATSADVHALIETVESRVFDMFRIRLQREIVMAPPASGDSAGESEKDGED